MLVGDRIVEGIDDALALVQLLGIAVGIVEIVGPAAVGVDRDRAVDSDDGSADVRRRPVDVLDREHGAAVGIGVVGEHVARRRRVTGISGVAGVDAALGHGIRTVGIGIGRRPVVDARVDYGGGAPRQRAVGHADRVSEAVGLGLADGERLKLGLVRRVERRRIVGDLAVLDPDLGA